MKILKFVLISLFLFFLVYQSKNKFPGATELKTLDFITTVGIDIEEKISDNDSACSITYVTNSDFLPDEKKEETKGVFNVKSDTFNSVIEKIQNLTNKSMTSSHLKYVLIGEDTIRNGLGYFIKNYANNPKMRLDTGIFITGGMTTEEFFNKMTGSDTDINKRLDGMTDTSGNVASLTKKNLKDLFQLYYSDEKSGVIPILTIEKNPEKKQDDNEKKESENPDDEKYTFDMNSLAIIKNGRLTGKIEKDLIQSFLILNNKIKNFTIKTEYEKNFYVFRINKAKSEKEFVIKGDKLEKVIFNIEIETDFEESNSDIDITKKESLNLLNEIQNKEIKTDIEKLIELSKSTQTDIIGILEALSLKHPGFYNRNIKNLEQKSSILNELKYEINITTEVKRFYSFMNKGE